jgi:hypothetical protein
VALPDPQPARRRLRSLSPLDSAAVRGARRASGYLAASIRPCRALAGETCSGGDRVIHDLDQPVEPGGRPGLITPAQDGSSPRRTAPLQTHLEPPCRLRTSQTPSGRVMITHSMTWSPSVRRCLAMITPRWRFKRPGPLDGGLTPVRDDHSDPRARLLEALARSSLRTRVNACRRGPSGVQSGTRSRLTCCRRSRCRISLWVRADACRRGPATGRCKIAFDRV